MKVILFERYKHQKETIEDIFSIYEKDKDYKDDILLNIPIRKFGRLKRTILNESILEEIESQLDSAKITYFTSI